MNYRHAFHAGNFSDVLKHIILTRILVHLQAKDTPFHVVDSHAGTGLTDLSGSRASRTGEWLEGIGRLLEADLPPAVAALLEPYLAITRTMVEATPPLYPGSPWLALALARPQDRFTFCELHPEDADALHRNLFGDSRVTVIEGDGYEVVANKMPPREKRGVVLIDPPFEVPREFVAIADAIARAHKRWAGGIYAIWYPIKARRDIEAFMRRMAGLGIPKIWRVEIGLYRVERIDRLNGCGLLIINPPWHLPDETRLIAPSLAAALAREGKGMAKAEWLVGE